MSHDSPIPSIGYKSGNPLVSIHALIVEHAQSISTTKALFSSEIFWFLATVALLFLFGKNCLIMDYLGLKNLSHDFSAKCVISFFSSTFSTPCMCRKIRCDGES